MDTTYIIIIHEDDLPVKGNAMASGDDDLDTKVENEILERLDQGDTWAWASVEVKCSVNVNGETFSGSDHLGACSYKDEENFKTGGYYEQLMAGAMKDLIENMNHAIRRGNVAQKALASHGRE